MKKTDPLDELARTVKKMRDLGVVKFGDIELGPEPADEKMCVHKVKQPAHCEMCERESKPPRPNLPRFKRPEA